jgi:outer membrane receptor protein involved in Fe transport
MGSAHTSVYVDGVKVGNMQSGQNDLGMLGIEYCSDVVLDYAQNTVCFNTSKPSFRDIPVAGTIRLSAGSFGTCLPSARVDFRLSDKVSLSANASGIFSKGDYGYGDGLRRTNNDISQIRSGLDLWGMLDEGDYHLKAYFNTAERGTPGSIAWPSDDRQKDMNAFVQGRLTNRFSPLYTLNLSLKAGYDDIFYTSIYGDSEYGQTEVQLNSSHSFQITQGLKLSLAADLQWDGLNSSNYNASRLTAFSALGASYISGRFAADASLELNMAYDNGAQTRTAVSPSIDFKYTVFKGFDIRSFARRSYRIPVFNELYYAGYGNPELKPEDAWMTDLAVQFKKVLGTSWKLDASLDAFCNWLTDKIISAPSEDDPNIWQPYNIGKVLSAGYDAEAGLRYVRGSWIFAAKGQYTFQSAVDRTSGSESFGQQIPYIARHIAILRLELSWKGWKFDPSWQWRGGRTDGYGDLPAWNTLDVEFSKKLFMKKAGSLVLKVAARNLADCRYETVSGYPMPGRNFIGGIEYSF